MKLVHKSTGQEVQMGEELTSFRGEKYIVESASPPHKPSSCGFVYVKPVDGDFRRELYVTVFDLEWRDEPRYGC